MNVANIFEVAKRAGVSIATVSRVLTKPEAVAVPTRRKVLQVVDRLGYAPNSAGKQLRTQRSGKLLVIVPDISNPFYSRVVQSIEDAAQGEGYAVLLGDTQRDRKREERYLLMLRRREAEGLIVLGHGLPVSAVDISDEMLKKGTPIVSSCELTDRPSIPGVHINNRAAASDAMAHLYSLGHRRMGIVTGPMGSRISRERLRGVSTRARAQGGREDVVVLNGDFTIESGEQCAERLLSRPEAPSAMFCFNDQMAIGAMNVARRRGLRVPEDVSIVGFDDIAFARCTNPPLTTIAQPVREMGEETVRLILGIVRGQAPAPASVVLPHTLIVRESTAPPPR